MKLAFVLFKYFPYSGLARDCLRIANECIKRGHQVKLYAMTWQGDQPEHIEVEILTTKAFSNHIKIKKYHQRLLKKLQQNPVDLLVGFNRMPNLDLYYAADPCFKQKSQQNHAFLYQYTPRYRLYSRFEAAVFDPSVNVELLFIAKNQIPIFTKYYDTPPLRFHLLPPGIALDRKRPPNAEQKRLEYRQQLGIKKHHQVLLMVGSVYHGKGVDRTLQAIASLPHDIKQNIKLMVAGLDDNTPYLKLAAQLKIESHILFMEPRQDIAHLLLAADLFLHPARHENTGTVLLEAIVAGLPQIISAACGYAFHIEKAQAGQVLAEPFLQQTYNQTLLNVLTDSEALALYQQKALEYAKTEDLYQLPEKAVDIIEGTAKQRKKPNYIQQKAV